MNDVQFDNLQWANLIWAVIAVALIILYGLWRRHRALKRFADSSLLPRLTPGISWTRQIVKLVLLTIAMGAMVLGAVGPRWGQRQQQVVRRNIDVMVLLDVSKSMLARDVAPSRLERAKLAIRDDLLKALGGDRIGLITFAGKPTLKCPLTSDYGFFRLALDDVSTESSPRGGTLIGDAIRLASPQDDAQDPVVWDSPIDTHKLIILITDGEDHDSYLVNAARNLWKDEQIPIVALSIGDEREGARIPINEAGTEFLKYNGETVWTKADANQLRQIGTISDVHQFFDLGTKNFDLGEIYQKIVEVMRVRAEAQDDKVIMPSRYHGFAVAAFVLLLIESLVAEGKRFSKTMRLNGYATASESRKERAA